MTLDERVRAGLKQSAGRGHLDADDALEQVHSSHERGQMRGRVVRQATAVVVVLALFVGVAIFVSARTAPYRYRGTAAVAVSGPATGSTGGFSLKLADPADLALAPATRRAALTAAHGADPARIKFRVARRARDRLAMSVTAPDERTASAVLQRWIAELGMQRRHDAEQQLGIAREQLTRRVASLHRKLRAIDAELAQLDPAVYHGLPRYDGPNGNIADRGPKPPPVPEHGTVHELNLAFERIQILRQLGTAESRFAQLRIAAFQPELTTNMLGHASTAHLDQTPPAARPGIIGLLAAVIVVVIGAFVLYRRRVRPL